MGPCRHAPGNRTRIWCLTVTFLIRLALPSCCRTPHGSTLTLVPWWKASPVSKVDVESRLVSRYSSRLFLAGVCEPWWWQRLFRGACCWEHPGGHTSRGSGKVLHRRRSSRGLGDLSLVLETFFLASSTAVTGRRWCWCWSEDDRWCGDASCILVA